MSTLQAEPEISLPDRLPPHNLEAEQCFLGSLLICEDDALRRRMRSLLRREAFFSPDHAMIFDAACAVLDQNRALDGKTLVHELRQRGQFDEVGGKEYLRAILNSMPSAAHGESYGQIVADMAQRREAITVANQLVRTLTNPNPDERIGRIIEAGIGQLWQICQDRKPIDVFNLPQIVAEFLERKEQKKTPALLTGIPPLDEFPGLFGFGRYTVIAGRPSMGKSTFLRWLLGQWAGAGTRIGLVAVEEDREKIAGNYLSAETEIQNDYVANREFTKVDWDASYAAMSRLNSWQWYGVDCAFSLDEVSSAVDILATKHACKVIAVDHLHLIGTDRKYENEQREVKEISRRLKELGKKYGVVLIAAAQLSRPEKNVHPKPPTMTDLRASGAIEEHADAILLLHREDYYRPREDPTHECEIGIAKNRNGRRGRCVLTDELEFQRFRAPLVQPTGESSYE